MINIIERRIVKLVECGIIKDEDKDLYFYGIHQGIIIIANVATIMLIGFILGMIWQSIVFMLTYIPLRSYAGGYHANTQLSCYVYSIILISAVLLAARFIPWTIFLIVGVTLVSGVAIFILSPVENSNKPLDMDEIKVYKRRSQIILGVIIFLNGLMISFSFEKISIVITTSVFATACVLLIGKAKKNKLKFMDYILYKKGR